MGEITRGKTCDRMRLFPFLLWAAGELRTRLGALERQHSEERCLDGPNLSPLLE